jgi:autotransporter-associated beta strand protein
MSLIAVKKSLWPVCLAMFIRMGWAVLLAFSCCFLGINAEASSEIIVLGDTQYYLYKPPPNTLDAQNNWIVQNLYAENISFVTQVGDITDWGPSLAFMQSADEGMKILDGAGPYGVVPYSVTAGNHDLAGATGATNFVKYFGQSRYTNYSWFGGASGDQLNNYQVFSMNGTEYLHLNLRFDPDLAALAWAQGVLNAHPNIPTIVSTHEYMGHYFSGRNTEGDFLWNNLISPNSQVFMVLCGHDSPEQHQVSTNLAGNKVIEIQADFQELPNGGDGWLQKLIFDPDAGQIRVKTYSPTLNAYKTASIDEFTFSANFGSRITVNGEISPVRNWCGGGGVENWSSSANWSLAPVNGDMLAFSGTVQQNIYNDWSLSSVGVVTFKNGGFSVNGNPLALNAGIANTGNNTWGINSTLAANQSITAVSGTLTLSGTIDTNGNLLTINGSGNVAVTNSIYGLGGLTKTGSGNVSLTAANYYTGPTAVNGGRLILSGYLASPVTVAPGAALNASGTIDNSVTLANTGRLEIGSTTSDHLNVNYLTFLGNAALNLSPDAASPYSGIINVFTYNGLTADGSPKSVAINIGGGLLRVGIYRLINYAGDIQGSGFDAFKLGTVPSGMMASLANDPGLGAIDLVVTQGIIAPSIWKGSGSYLYWSNSANWDVAPLNGNTLAFSGTAPQTMINDSALTNVGQITFKNGGFYVAGNALNLFSGLNDSGDNTWAIDSNLMGNQTFQVNSGTLTVSGMISGPGMVSKTGSGTLKLTNPNSFTGGFAVNAGSLMVSHPNALGSGDVSIASGQIIFDLDFGSSAAFANNFRLPPTGMPEFSMNNPSWPTTVRLTGKISGGAAGQSYTFADSGANSNHNNTLILDNDANDFRGNIRLARGCLGITSNGALGNANNGLICNVGGGNGGLVFCADNVSIAPTHSLQLLGEEVINVQNYTATIACPVSGPGGFTKTGAGSLTLLGANSYSGATVVSEGHLTVNGSLMSSSVTVAGGATLGGSGTINHAVTILDSGTLEAGGSLAPATFTLSSLTFSDRATLNLSPNVTSPTTNAMVVNSLNGLTVGGSLDSIVVNVRGIAGVGSYHLIDYQGAIQGFGFNAFMLGTLPPGMEAALVNNVANSSIDLSVTHAAISTSFWTGYGWDNRWGTESNWDVSPSNGSSLIFSDIPTGTLVNNHSLSDVRSVTLSSGGCTIVGDPLNLHGGIVNTGNNTWAINSVLKDNQTIQVNSGTLTVTGTMAGDRNLTKTGPGKLILEDCQLTGDVTIATGTLEVDSLIGTPHVTVQGTLIAGSIVADTLTIGKPPHQASLAVPEPAMLVFLGWVIPFFMVLLIFRSARRPS